MAQCRIWTTICSQICSTITKLGDKTEEDLEDEGNVITKKSEVKIEVLNGSGEKANLDKVVNAWKGAGYKISKKGITNTTAKTVIIKDKDVGSTITNNISEVLEMKLIQSSETTGGTVDITIIIGKDYNWKSVE